MARESFVRVKVGAPVSADLGKLAGDLAFLAQEAAFGTLSMGEVTARLEMYARRAEELEGMARAVEARAQEVA